jgi:Flp pilus assembly protein TadG
VVQKANAERKSGILVRLAKNEEGNVIALLAAAVIPAIGLMGGAVDLSRMYLTQTRLQAACDAGVLMGRKTMGVGSWSSANNYPNTMALQMLDQNFARGAYGSRDLERGFAEIDGNVAGSASATIPMALMQVLNVSRKQISVTCKAAMNTPDSDVMFVLDVTGSMIDGMSGDASGVGSKLDNLKIAVKCFYEALAKQNIEGVRPDQCGEATNPPANSTIGNVQLRFGFVPYAQNVNVGRLLPKDYMADQWSYQSRVPTYDLGTSNFTGWTY